MMLAKIDKIKLIEVASRLGVTNPSGFSDDELHKAITDYLKK
jgi:L-lysine 2,3-aminomutase